MKRAICAAALSALLLCGCGSNAAPPAASSAGESDMLIVTESYAEEGGYTDSLDNSWSYSYHVPRLPADTEGAAAINASIDLKFGQPVREALSEMAEGISLSCVTTAWKSYRCGDIVSIVVWAEADWEFTDYGVYLYNIATGEQMTTVALLDTLGVEQEEFLAALRRAACNGFDAQGLSGSAKSSAAFLPERSWTVGEENITTDVMTYALEDGTLRVILPIGTPAGAGWYYQTLTPKLNGSDGETAFTAGDYTLTWTSGAETMTLRGANDLQATVYGAWSVYIGAALIPSQTEGESEFLVLLTESGQVEYIDVTRGLAGGTLCLMPLGGVGDAVSLETAAENDALCAVTSDNRWVELSPLLTTHTAALPELLVGTWHMTLTDNGVERDCWLTVSADGTATWQQGMMNSPDNVCYTGTATCLGTAAEGMVLYLDMTGSAADGEPPLRCALTAVWGWEGVHFKQLSGDPLLPAEGYVWIDRPAG